MFRVTPGCVWIDSLGDVLPLSIARAPLSTPPRHQRFVHCHALGFSPSLPDRVASLQQDGLPKQDVAATISVIERRPARELLPRKPLSKLCAPALPLNELGSFRFSPMHDANHDHHCEHPVWNLRRSATAGSRPQRFRESAVFDSDSHQFLQGRANPGSLSHDTNSAESSLPARRSVTRRVLSL